MIRKFDENDLNNVMKIWLNTNIETHCYIPDSYWKNNYEKVKESFPQAEIYVYEDATTEQVIGFIGLMGDYLAGFFVSNFFQSKGVGKELISYVKNIKSSLELSVYQKNVRAIRFYERENFVILSEGLDENTNEKEFLMKWMKESND